MGSKCVQALAAEDGGGYSLQPVAAQVQLLQLLKSCQFTAKGGGMVTWIFISAEQVNQIGLAWDLNLTLKSGSSFRKMTLALQLKQLMKTVKCELIKTWEGLWT